MDTYSVITLLIKNNGTSQAKLEKELGFSNGSISKWRKSKPTTERLQKVADYFNVPLQYLLTGEMPAPRQAPQLSSGSSELLEIYSGLDTSGRNTLLTVARALASGKSSS